MLIALLTTTNSTLPKGKTLESEVKDASAERIYQIINSQKVKTFADLAKIATDEGSRRNEKWTEYQKNLTTWIQLTGIANNIAKSSIGSTMQENLDYLPVLLNNINSAAEQLHKGGLTKGESANLAHKMLENQKKSNAIIYTAWQELMKTMHQEWSNTKPKLSSSILTKNHKNFMKVFEEMAPTADFTVADLNLILQTSGIVEKTMKSYQKSSAIGDLLLNLEQYVYLLNNHYRARITHREKKIQTAQRVIPFLWEALQTLPAPIWQTTMFGKTNNKAAVTLLAQASAYADTSKQLYTELNMRALKFD